MLNEKGQTLVELALVIVLLLTLVVGFTEFSRAWNTTTVLANAARSGARYASKHPADTSYVADVKDYTAFQVMTGLKAARTNVTVDLEAFSSGLPDATKFTLDEGVAPPLTAGARVTVSVKYTFQGLGGNIVPVISTAKEFVRSSTMRYEGN